MHTGLRYKNVELSTIDTGLLMAGILASLSYFDGDNATERELRDLAEKLYRRVEWDWAMDDRDVMSMGWHPESGFIKSYWYGYNEAMVLLVMAIGSPTHPIPPSAWDVWTSTYEYDKFYGFEMVNFGPLFGHQYSHMFIDFKGIFDGYMKAKGFDYFENTRRAACSQRYYAIANPKKFKGYGENIWGFTACDGPGYSKHVWNGKEMVFDGYSARGAAYKYDVDDGTIAPTAAGGSVPFAPEIAIPALEAMYDQYGSQIYKEYGFLDSFNPSYTWAPANEKGWVDIDYLGIDQGPIVVMINNYHSGTVWNAIKKNPYIVTGLKKAGFRGGWLDAIR
jgi:hypothetical protein